MKWFFAVFLSFCMVFLAIFAVQGVYSYLFPLKYQEIVAAASEKYNVDEAVIFSCINVESRFNAEAISAKGAVGLMQVMPATATELAGGGDFDLTNPEENIAFGTQYLAKMIAKFDDLSTAVCAYNAGPATVTSWLADENYSTDGVTLCTIPYEETRNYLKKFNQNLKYYRTKCAH